MKCSEFDPLELFQQVNKLYSNKMLKGCTEHMLDNFSMWRVGVQMAKESC